MHNWGTIQLLGLTGKETDIADIAARHQPIYAKYKAYRAEVLEAALFIESRLDVLLCTFFVDKNPERELLFRSLVLDPESGTFFTKWRMLRGAFDIAGVPALTETERKSLLSGLKQLINDRNKFAHGNLYVDVRDGCPVLHYYEACKKEDRLSDDKIETVLANARTVHNILEKVIAATN